MRREGRTRFLLRHGLVGRALPMTLATVVLLEAYEGRLGPARLAEVGFYARLLGAFALFALGGVLSALARWKALEARFGAGEDGPDRGRGSAG